MTLAQLKDWLNSLPEEFNDYTVVNGETGELDGNYFYRVDKPVTSLTVDEENNEIVILNDTKDGKYNPEDED